LKEDKEKLTQVLASRTAIAMHIHSSQEELRLRRREVGRACGLP